MEKRFNTFALAETLLSLRNKRSRKDPLLFYDSEQNAFYGKLFPRSRRERAAAPRPTLRNRPGGDGVKYGSARRFYLDYSHTNIEENGTVFEILHQFMKTPFL